MTYYYEIFQSNNIKQDVYRTRGRERNHHVHTKNVPPLPPPPMPWVEVSESLVPAESRARGRGRRRAWPTWSCRWHILTDHFPHVVLFWFHVTGAVTVRTLGPLKFFNEPTVTSGTNIFLQGKSFASHPAGPWIFLNSYAVINICSFQDKQYKTSMVNLLQSLSIPTSDTILSNSLVFSNKNLNRSNWIIVF